MKETVERTMACIFLGLCIAMTMVFTTFVIFACIDKFSTSGHALDIAQENREMIAAVSKRLNDNRDEYQGHIHYDGDLYQWVVVDGKTVIERVKRISRDERIKEIKNLLGASHEQDVNN